MSIYLAAPPSPPPPPPFSAQYKPTNGISSRVAEDYIPIDTWCIRALPLIPDNNLNASVQSDAFTYEDVFGLQVDLGPLNK